MFGVCRTFLSEIIDRLGEESSKAQKLQIPITTTSKFTANTNDDLIYLMFTRSNVSKQSRFKEIGFIRFGKRDLYFDDGTSLKHLVNCPSILGIYHIYQMMVTIIYKFLLFPSFQIFIFVLNVMVLVKYYSI